MEALIRAAGRLPRQRTTLYGSPPRAQQAKSYGAAPLAPVVQQSLSYAEAMGLQQPTLSCM
jgi:FO synthase